MTLSRTTWGRLGAAALGFAVALGLAEGASRLVVRVDDDGQRWLGERRILPWRMPRSDLERRIQEAGDPASLFVSDPDLGWAPRPNARSRSGLASIDASGARRGGPPATEAGRLRIVTVGDSFTFGDEVGDADTWPAQLQSLLGERGRAAEVVNLGVNGYGIDQAVLRFERDGAPRRPDVVVLGLQPENLLRNLNVLRPVFFPGTALPFSKPRFVLAGDDLALVNHPAAPPEAVLEALRAPEDSPLIENEFWFDDRYAERPWHRSVLASVVDSLLREDDAGAGYAVTPEMAALGDRLVARLARSADAVDARLLVVVLPRREDVLAARRGDSRWYDEWLQSLAERRPVVRPDLDRPTWPEDGFEAHGHYSPPLNRAVAEALTEALLAPEDADQRDRDHRSAVHPANTGIPTTASEKNEESPPSQVTGAIR